MQCSFTHQALASLFFNVSISSFLLLLLLYSSALLLLKFFHFIGGYPLLQRNEDEYDYARFSDEEEEEEEESQEPTSSNTYYHVMSKESNHLIADVLDGGESLVFYNSNGEPSKPNKESTRVRRPQLEAEHEDGDSNSSSTEAQFSANDSPCPESEHDHVNVDDDDDQEITLSLHDVGDLARNPNGPTRQELPQSGFVFNDKTCDGNTNYNQEIEDVAVETDISSKDEKFFVFAPSQLQSRKLLASSKDGEEEEGEEIFGDSCTNGSTSKSSSEWRSSIKTEDPFSSSSRRSCPKWESYTLFQKYDEEMTFLGRISIEKLQETESLKSFQVEPRSISERIVHKFSNANKRPSSTSQHNAYQELESAYVAQICLTWEALSWNYANFERKRSRHRDFDLGCPAGVADQFRRFQILLQRYIENEPYEHGRRPEIYARMRMLAPKLLLVPEYQDCEEEEEKDEGFKSRISSASFMMIMEECIRTFMNFLKADKEKPCHKILKSFFGRSRRGSVDPTLLQLMKKVNKKKKMKLKDLRRGGKCMRKKKLRIEEEMEILMGLIDLKVVSRVLRMRDISEERLHWCEGKMSKVRIIEGKLLRDSSPLFFPSH